MPKVDPPKYPKDLTVAGWNKKKGLLARIKKIQTGITDELKRVQKEFDDVNWDSLEIAKLVPKNERLTAKRCEEILRSYIEKNHPTFKKLEASFHDLSQFLSKKASEFEKDKETKSFAKGVKEMADAANKFSYAIAWGTVSSDNQLWIEERKANALKAAKQKAEAVKGLKNIIYAALKAALLAKKAANLTSKSYERPYWSENLRGIGAQIKLAAPSLDPTIAKELLKILKEVAVLWNDKNLPKDEEVATRLDTDIEKLMRFKEIIDQAA